MKATKEQDSKEDRDDNAPGVADKREKEVDKGSLYLVSTSAC